MAAPRLTRWRIVTLLVLLLIVTAGWTTYRVVSAKTHLQGARDQLEVARKALVDRDLPTAQAAVQAAGVETKKARQLCGGPVVGFWSHVPLLGRSFAVARGVAFGADDIARDVLPPSVLVAKGLDPEALRRPDGSIDLALLAPLQAPTASAAARMKTVQRQARSLPSELLPGPVATARRDFTTEVDRFTTTLSSASDAVRLAPVFLGDNQERHWFVFVQQTGESRGTGGVIGGFAVLAARNGRLRVLQQGSNAELKSITVDGTSVDADFHRRYDLSGAFDIWANTNLSPNLPEVARLVAEKWKAQGGGSIDGVLTLDAIALADLLRGGDPIGVGDGQTVTADQLPRYLGIDQYVGVGNGDQSTRKDQLSTVAQAVLGRVTGGGGSSSALLKGVVAALQSGHVHFSTRESRLAPALVRTGLDGALPRGTQPVAYGVVNSASGDKLDYFLDRTIRYTGGGCHGSRRTTKIAFTVTNGAPAVSTLPQYVTLREVDGFTNSSTGRELLQVYGTKGAALISATLDGQAVSTVQGRTATLLESTTEGGLPAWEVVTDTPPGKAVTLELTLSEPVVKGRARVPEQPLARPLARDISLPTCT